MVVRIMKMMTKQVDHKAAVVGIQGRAHVNVGHCHVEGEAVQLIDEWGSVMTFYFHLGR